MSNIFTDAKRFLHNRFSGKIAKDIESAKECLKIINNIPPDDNFWLNWYKYHLKNYSKIRFIPRRFVMKKSIKKIPKDDDRLILKDINLPLPINESDNVVFMMVILDSLLSHLLDNIDKNLFYSLTTPMMEGPYEYKEVQLMRGDIVIDAGANIGEFSALAGVKGYKAYAFEPMPNIIDTYLSKTAKMNPNIEICQYALSDQKGELTFTESKINMASSSYVFEHKGNNNQVKVQSIDLDTFVDEHKLPSVDFLKADIEGAERYMLMGAKRVLKEFAPKIAICTYHLPDDPKVLRELILDANPNYIIEERWKKMYAYVPKG